MRPTPERESSSAQLSFDANSKIISRRPALRKLAWFKSSELLSARNLSLLIGVAVVVSLLTVSAHMQEAEPRAVVIPVAEKQDVAIRAEQAPEAAREASDSSGLDRSVADDSSVKYPYSTKSPANQTITSISETLKVPHAPLAGLTGLKNVPGDYATLALAITDLNANGVGAGGVTFNVTAAQTAPAGGYVIGGAGSLVLTSSSAANPITFTGNGNSITAFNPQTVSAINDGIIKLIGADFVTIQGFTLQENPANTIIGTGATNNATEFGIGLFYVTVTDGAQSNTIQNNTITMNRAYASTFCIFSTTRASSTAVGTTADATTPAGTNSNTKIYSNNLSNTNYAIVFLGSSVSSPQETGTDIGGSSIATGNTITNALTGAGALSTYITLTGSDYAIFLNHQINDNVSFNSITSAALTGAVTVGGFLKNYSVVQPTGTITTTINNNTVTITNNPSAAAAGGIVGINNQGLAPLLATATMSINSNTVQNCVLGGSTSTTNGITAITNLSAPGTLNMTGNTVLNNAITATTATTGIMGGISNSGAAGTANITNNILRGLASSATSGQMQGINSSGAVTTALNVNNNQLGNAASGYFTSTVATSGTLFGIVTSTATSACALSIQTNDIRGITYNVASSAAHAYYQNSAATLSQNISNNTFTNLNVNTTGSVTFISDSVSLTASGAKNINNNQIVTGFNKAGIGGTITLYNDGASSVNGSIVNNNNNNFSNMSFSGTTALGGWFNQDGLSNVSSATKTITGNTFNNITGGTGQINVLSVNFSGPSTVTGNTISNVTGAGVIIGLNIGSNNGQGTHTYASNTVTNLTSNSPGGGVNGIQGGSASIVTLNLNNNSISALSQTGGANQINPIILTAGATVNVFKNRIANIQSNNAGASINGIAITSGSTYNIYNNLIGDLRLPSANAANPLVGILLSAPATANVYYNTVYLNATSSGAAFGSTAIFASTTTTTTLRNNIFVNTSLANATGLTAAYRRSTTLLTSYGAASNNNLFYAGTPSASNVIFYDATNTDQTLADFKTRVSTRDSASVTENPPLNTVSSSPQFLHVNDALGGSQILNAAAPIAGFADDFDSDTRDAATPEIGADEVVDVKFAATLYAAPEGGTAILDVVRTGGAGGPLDVSFTTSNGSAVGGVFCTPGVDYIGNAGSLHFNAGVTLQQIGVLMCNDSVYEGATPENLTVTLSNPVGDGILGSPVTTTVNITEDEVQPTATIDNITQNETNAGTTTFTFTVMLSGASSTATTINYSTSDVSATGGADYVSAIAQSIVIPPLQTSGAIPITVTGDTDVEPDETFSVTISSPDVLIGGGGVGVGTITNDDVCVTTLTVNDGGDDSDANPGDGLCATSGAVCTLRAAMEESNALSSCAALTILFDLPGTGQQNITLLSSLPVITHSVNIQGPTDDSMTLSAAAGRVFEITTATTVNISNLNVTQGTGFPNGGGLANSGSATVNIFNSTFFNNAAFGGGGGAIYNSAGVVNIWNTTISGNFSNEFSGGGNGGGVFNNGGTMTLTNCTVSDNEAFANAGGVYVAGGTLKIRNTIVAANRANTNVDAFGAFTSQGHNLIGDGTGATGFGATGDQVGTLVTPIDPLLDLLQFNDGPTQTQALRTNSTAVDAGDDCVLTGCSGDNPIITADQRGIPRPQNTHVDIGAYELRQFVVNTTADHDDLSCSAADCTLREAINATNSNPGSVIRFAIDAMTDSGCVSATGVCTITPASALPAITSTVLIDGYTQTGATPNSLTLSAGDNAALKIVLDCTAVGAGGRGYDVEGASGVVIRGFNIIHCGAAGIWLHDSGGNSITGNFIGTNVTGTSVAASANADGVVIDGDSNGNEVGGDLPGARNVITGNGGAGINLSGNEAFFNIVEGNYIGTNANGTSIGATSNSTGIRISGSTDNTIGCAVLDGDNVISGNTTFGIFVENSAGNYVTGNFIGTDRTGAAALANGSGGVKIIDSTNNTIGDVGVGNTISGNSGDGVLITRTTVSASVMNNKVLGNLIGTDVTGMLALANNGDGVKISGAAGNDVGGSNTGQGNVISSNAGNGVELTNGAVNNAVLGNFVGLAADGLTLQGNQLVGVEINTAPSPRGLTPSGSPPASPTPTPSASGTSNNLIGFIESVGQRPGLAIDAIGSATGKFDNARWKVASQWNALKKRRVTRHAARSNAPTIANISGANIIAGNTVDGVQVSDATDVNNTISNNSIYGNGGLGINLGTDVVTPNDSGDGDTGPNNLQNFPTLFQAAVDTQTIEGNLDSAGGSYTIEFFDNGPSGCDSSGFGEGKLAIGSLQTSSGSFNVVLSPGSFAAGDVITATATDGSGNTSEFSACFVATPAAVPPSFSIDDVSHNEGDAGATSYTFTISKAGTTGSNATVSYETVDGSATAPSDFTAITTTPVTFLPNETTKQFTVLVNGDVDVEPNEAFTVHLSNPSGAVITDADGTGTITNDDNAADYTVTTVGNVIVVTDVSGNGDTLAMTEPVNGSIKFAAAARFFSVNGGVPINGDSGNLSLTSANSVTVNQGEGSDTLDVGAFTLQMPSLTINGGNGDDTVNLNGTMAFVAGNQLDIDLQNDTGTPGVDSVNIGSGASIFMTTSGGATIRASRNFTMAPGSSLQVENGAMIIEANLQATPTSGDFNGVDVDGGSIYTVGSGNVVINGKGGAGDFIENVGVRVGGGGLIASTSSGTLAVQGTGGAGSGGANAGSGNVGVYVTGSGSIIRSATSATQITGIGGVTNDSNVLGVIADELGTFQTDGAGALTINGTGGTVVGGSLGFVNSGGVFIAVGDVNGDGGFVKSTGTGANAGNIIITGTGTNGGNGSAQGVRVDAPASVTTVDGHISITGTTGACGNACLGVSIRGDVTATGNANITIDGAGGASTGAFPTHGVNVRQNTQTLLNGKVATVNGDIAILATGGSSTGTDNAGFDIGTPAQGTLQTTGTGRIIVNADNIRINPAGSNATINAGANIVSLRQRTAGVAIDVGASAVVPAAGTLELSDLELDRVAAGQIDIGNSNTGPIKFTQPITRAAATNINPTSSANIDITTGSVNTGGGSFSPLPATNFFPLRVGVDVNTGANTTFLATALKIVITNTTVDTGYTQLNLVGLVNLNNAVLQLSGSNVPVAGQTFMVVNNDSNDPIVGAFNGLPQGSIINNFFGSGLNAQINYTGGDGNDAVLTVLGCPSAFTVNSNLDTNDAAPGDSVCATAAAVCTLRAAVQEANASGPCGAININFSIPTSTITVASELSITHSVNINGPVASSITVTGTAAVPTRVFVTQANTTVNISNLTVSGGRAAVGAGLLALGPNSTTTLNGMLFTGNIAIDPTGFTGGGGAASGNGGTLNIRNSTFSGNTGTHGGAISVQGNSPLNLVNVTITNNLADGNTGTGPCPIGGSVDGDGGGIQGSSMPPALLNIRNSIVAFNQDCNANQPNLTGQIIDQGNNITFNDPSLNLGPLQNNGGPTFTYGLLAFSSAIDSGNDCVLTNVCVPPYGVAITADQRGFPRPANGDTVPAAHVDIGAFEKQTPSAANSSITGRIVDSSGTPLEGAAIRLSGSQDRLTVTDKEGNYRFEDVATNGLYTVTPSRANFSFTPGDRTFTLLGDHTDALFTAFAASGFVNPLDTTEYFVRQQYLDFLNREPDEAGLSFWVNNINACGADAICRSGKRTDTSAAFFLSIEFHETGYLVYRAYQSAYGEIPGAPVPLNLAEFQPDTAMIGEDLIVNAPDWQAKLEANKQAYFAAFVARSRFTAAYSNLLMPAEFVDRLFSNAGVTPNANDRAAVIAEFANAQNSSDLAARAHALRRVAENSALARQKESQAFVLMQYFGYLHRDPNALPDGNFAGYDFWLHKLEEFNGDFRRAEMVKAFLVAGEYRGRFPR
jgi:CSLREA domain-containing protein